MNRVSIRRRCLFVFAAVLLSGLIALPARASRAVGVDVSQYQGTMDWETAYDAGARFAFVRSSRGGTTFETGRVDDTMFSQNMQALADLSATGKTIYAGAYHYGRPDTLVADLTDANIIAHAEDQAQHFYDIAGDYMAPGYLRPVLDLEVQGMNPSTGVMFTTAQESLWVNAFIDHLESLSGAEALIYCGTRPATYYVDSSVADRNLWLARYNSPLANPQTDNPQTPGGYPNPYGVWNDPIGSTTPSHDSWSFWQYTASGSGATWGVGIPNQTIDLDVANGDLAFVQGFLVPEPSSIALIGLSAAALRRRRR